MIECVNSTAVNLDFDMMARNEKIRKIREDYEAARHKKKDHAESIIYAVEQNPNCTSAEFVYGIYPLHALSLPVDKSSKQKVFFGKVKFLGGKDLWRLDKHAIVEDTRFPDHRIIRVKRELKTVEGKIATYFAQGFAVGEDAIYAATRRRKVIKGMEKEIQDYHNKAADPNLGRRLTEAKRRRAREIQKWVREK